MKELLVAFAVVTFSLTQVPAFAQTKKPEPTTEVSKEEAKKSADTDAAKKATAEKDVAQKADQPDAKKDSKKKVKKGGC